MATEHFCLRWNNHQSTLVSVFDNLLESGTLVDCTLAADGRYLKAHKVVLSACSPYLGMLLSQHYDKHPIIILKDVKFDELKAMLDYMYRGEVNISQEQLSTFLKAAETLQIKGLTDAGSDEGNGLQPNRPPSSNSTTSANEDPQSPGPPGDGGSSPGTRKRKRNKHGDDGDGDSASKISLSEGSDRLSATSVGSPSAKSMGVKREPGDGEGDGQMSVDESGEVVMMSRPGPSNGGTNNKAPWILSADSSGEEMQLTPVQDGKLRVQNQKKENSEYGSELKVEPVEQEEAIHGKDPLEGEIGHSWYEENRPNTGSYPGFMYKMARSGEDELIIPDHLEEPNILLNVAENVQSHLKSNCVIIQRDEAKIEKRTIQTVQELTKTSCKTTNKEFLQKQEALLQPPLKPNCTTIQRDEANLETMIRGGKHLNSNSDWGLTVNEDLSTSVKNTSKAFLKIQECRTQKSMTGISKLHPMPSDNNHLVAKAQCQINHKSTQPSLSTSPKPVNAREVHSQQIHQIKKKTFDLAAKYRSILPAPEDVHKSSLPYGAPSVQSTITSAIEKLSTDTSVPQCSTSSSNSSVENVVQTTNTSGPDNNSRLQPRISNNSPLPTPSTNFNISVPQQIQVGKMSNPAPSLISICQPLQGSQMMNNTSSVLTIPQNVQPSPINNANPSVLSISPQFTISPIQLGNSQMSFCNSNLQARGFQSTQFYTNTSVSQSQMMNNQNAQPILQPVYVAPNVISPCQTSNQFFPSTVQYNFTSGQSFQSNYGVSTSQSQPVNTSTSIVSSTSGNNQPIYVRTPEGFVPALNEAGNKATVTKLVRYKGRGRPALQESGKSSSQPNLSTCISILPKKSNEMRIIK